MKIIALNEVEKNEVHMDGAVGAWKQLPLGNDDGTPVYSYRVFTVDPGGHTPFHQHPYEHMNYVIEGSGALVNEKGEEQPLKAQDYARVNEAGKKSTLKTGDFALVNPDEKHLYYNLVYRSFKMICGMLKKFE